MITMSSIGAYGRLGNQLSQYAALKALSLKKRYEFKIPDQSNMSWHGQKSLLNEFNIEAEVYTNEEFKKIVHHYKEPDWRTIDKNFFNVPDNTNFEGFFQSTWYFEEFENQIKKELTPKEKYLDEAKIFLDNVKKQYQGYEIVSIHIRRGNVVNDASMKDAYNNYYNNGGYFNYLNKAKQVFKNKKVKFLVFSGGAKWDENNINEINWCKKNLIGNEYIFSENSEPLEDFSRIMLCDHNIMSPASSFGWWAAYLNPNLDKIIVAPKAYLVDEPDFVRYKFYPEYFILI